MEDTGIHVDSLNSHSSYHVLVYFIECMFHHWICAIRTISRDCLKVVFALFCFLKIFTSFCRYAKLFTLMPPHFNLELKFQVPNLFYQKIHVHGAVRCSPSHAILYTYLDIISRYMILLSSGREKEKW